MPREAMRTCCAFDAVLDMPSRPATVTQPGCTAPPWKLALQDAIRRSRALSAMYARYLVRAKHLERRPDWLRSYREQQAVDADGQPVPWLTYAAIARLERGIRPDFDVFEYGSGNSTLWWAARVRRIVTCEHDASWAERIRTRLPENARLEQVDLPRVGPEGYAATIDAWPRAFDVVVIDGDPSTRTACSRHAEAALKPGGVIVWDNAELAWDQPGFEALEARGFRRFEFAGLAPIVPFPSITAIFARERNVLDL